MKQEPPLSVRRKQRLQKFMAAAGICSRRKAEQHILAGRVAVNGHVVDRLGTSVDPELDQVTFDGRPVRVRQKMFYIMLHKPLGYVSSCRHAGEKSVLELVDRPERLFPVGRLDKDSTGLLLLTNDGPIHHRLSHPSFNHEKEYIVTCARPVSDADLGRLSRGLIILGRRTRKARVVRIGPRRFKIVLKEGRNRQVRRMVRAVGNQVTTLVRTRFATLKLGDLAPGAWRFLEQEEVKRLLKAAKL